jgi:hypothetical protein
MKVKWNPIGAITASIEKEAMDRLHTAAGYVAGMARSLVPVGEDKYSDGVLIHKSGALRRTIRVGRLPGDPNLNIIVIAGKKGIIDYAAVVEYGGRYQKQRAYMRPALDAVKNRINSIMSGGY